MITFVYLKHIRSYGYSEFLNSSFRIIIQQNTWFCFYFPGNNCLLKKFANTVEFWIGKPLNRFSIFESGFCNTAQNENGDLLWNELRKYNWNKLCIEFVTGMKLIMQWMTEALKFVNYRIFCLYANIKFVFSQTIN